MRHELARTVAITLWVGLLLSGCAHERAGNSARGLYTQVHIGMARVKVERLLGAPTAPSAPLDPGIWYLPPPDIEPYESPFAPGTIGITYTPMGKVETKVLNPQFRD